MKRLGVAPVLLLGGCGQEHSALLPAGTQAAISGQLLVLFVVICGAMYLLVIGALGWSAWRKRGVEAPPMVQPDDHGLTRSLALWIGLVVAGLLVLAGASFVAERRLAAARGSEALTVLVTGHQWWWRIEYRDPATGLRIETANELHLPLGRTARIELASADVIHSFWVPNVSGKLDMIPGRANSIDLTPTKAGWFRGQCAEFCGVQHAHMALDVKVESPAEFRIWLSGQAKPAAAGDSRGMQIVTGSQCAACHAIRGTPAVGRVGPDLTHLASRRAIAAGTAQLSRGALQGWIAQPQAMKPGTLMPPVALTPADADAASRYLMGLK